MHHPNADGQRQSFGDLARANFPNVEVELDLLGDEPDPEAYMIATVSLESGSRHALPLCFHLQAIRVRQGKHGNHVSSWFDEDREDSGDPCLDERIRLLEELEEGKLATAILAGSEYLIWLAPSGD